MPQSDSILKNCFGQMSKASAGTQITIGLIAGWLTGYAFTKVGEAIAIAIGGGLIILKVAEQQGYITINKNRNIKQTGDNVVEIYSSHTSKRWYTNLIGDEHSKHINELHLFIIAFGGGVALGMFKVHDKLLGPKL